MRRARPVFRNQFRERPFRLPEEEEEEYSPRALPEEEEEKEEEVGRSFVLSIFPLVSFISCKTSQFFFPSLYTPPLSLFDQMSRRKNKHPKRAVNVKTVVVASAVEEREEEEEPPVLCLRIPDEDEVVFEIEQKEIRKEKTTTKRGKRKRTQHECDVCEKRFRTSSQMKIHIRIHTNEKPYECDVCEKSFRQSGDLKRHKRIHTNEKPFECHVCEKRYRHYNSLKYHMRTQH